LIWPEAQRRKVRRKSIGDERERAPVRRPRGLQIGECVVGEPAKRPAGHVDGVRGAQPEPGDEHSRRSRADGKAKLRDGISDPWAVSAVKDAKSSPASEAVELGVVDGIAASLEDVISFANGREVTVAGEQVTLELTGAVTSEQTMSPFLSFIRLLSDPTIAFLLFSVGSAGLIAELWNPNFVTGILGGIAIILAFIGLGALPLNVGGLILVIFGIVLIGLELTVTSHGLLGFGGVLCLAIGATALFRPPTNPFEPLLQVAPLLIAVITVTAGAFVALVAFAAVRSRRYAQAGGVGLAVPSGTAGIVRRPLEPLGSIYAGGEEWSAKTSDGRSLERGTPVKVVGNAGLTLIVEPDRSPSSS